MDSVLENPNELTEEDYRIQEMELEAESELLTELDGLQNKKG